MRDMLRSVTFKRNRPLLDSALMEVRIIIECGKYERERERERKIKQTFFKTFFSAIRILNGRLRA